MTSVLYPNHPRQRLLFFVADEEVDDALRIAFASFVDRLAASRQWLLGPPEFVSTTEAPDDLAPGDTPVETIGAFLEIYTAIAPWSLPREIDLAHYEEVSALVGALREFTGQHGVTIELELDGSFVGSVKQGQMDRTLSEGLLGTWRRGLGIA